MESQTNYGQQKSEVWKFLFFWLFILVIVNLFLVKNPEERKYIAPYPDEEDQYARIMK